MGKRVAPATAQLTITGASSSLAAKIVEFEKKLARKEWAIELKKKFIRKAWATWRNTDSNTDEEETARISASELIEQELRLNLFGLKKSDADISNGETTLGKTASP